MNSKNVDSFATASLILGIVSIVFSFLNVWVGLITGIVGIVLATKGRNSKDKKGLATAGLVLSIIGTVLSGIFVACALCIIGTGISIINSL